jgi:hypothetical protein
MVTRGANSGTTVTRVPRPSGWQPARVVSIREETHRVRTIRLAVSNWPGHLPGQHADVRLTAEDGYRAERSYSIASPPEVSHRLGDASIGILEPGPAEELADRCRVDVAALDPSDQVRQYPTLHG